VRNGRRASRARREARPWRQRGGQPRALDRRDFGAQTLLRRRRRRRHRARGGACTSGRFPLPPRRYRRRARERERRRQRGGRRPRALDRRDLELKIFGSGGGAVVAVLGEVRALQVDFRRRRAAAAAKPASASGGANATTDGRALLTAETPELKICGIGGGAVVAGRAVFVARAREGGDPRNATGDARDARERETKSSSSARSPIPSFTKKTRYTLFYFVMPRSTPGLPYFIPCFIS
jgi:hypothetical protein